MNEEPNLAIQMKKRLFAPFAIITGLLSSCGYMDYKDDRLSELGFSEDHILVSTFRIFDGKQSFLVEDLVKNFFSDIGLQIDENEKYDIIDRTYGDDLYVISSFYNDEINYCGFLRISFPEQECRLIELLTYDDLVEKNLIEEPNRSLFIDCSIVLGFGSTISFTLWPFSNWKAVHVQFDYSATTLENTYVGRYKGYSLEELSYIDESHSVKVGRPNFLPDSDSGELVVENSSTGEEWDVVSSLKENEIYREITEDIYSITDCDYFYFICDGDFFVIVDNYEHVGMIPGPPIPAMSSCVFLSDIEHKTFSYIGYCPNDEDLTGILKIG